MKQLCGAVLLVLLVGCGGGASPAEMAATRATPAAAAYTRSQVLEARQQYRVEVISFDASQRFGTEFPYSDYVRVRITNGSSIALPFLTVMTKRLDTFGKMLGSSRAPAIPVRDLAPGQSAEFDYYPRGHLDGVPVNRIEVEIEQLISPDSEKFFPELQGTTT